MLVLKMAFILLFDYHFFETTILYQIKPSSPKQNLFWAFFVIVAKSPFKQ
jgi:hypothetical protein